MCVCVCTCKCTSIYMHIPWKCLSLWMTVVVQYNYFSSLTPDNLTFFLFICHIDHILWVLMPACIWMCVKVTVSKILWGGGDSEILLLLLPKLPPLSLYLRMLSSETSLCCCCCCCSKFHLSCSPTLKNLSKIKYKHNKFFVCILRMRDCKLYREYHVGLWSFWKSCTENIMLIC